MRSHSAFLALLGILAVSCARGQSPLGTAFTYQGRLESAGAPVNGSVNILCRLFDASALGNLLGSQTINGVTVSDGLFSLTLNAAGELGVFNGDRRWLEITINGTTLAPRQEVRAAPYALQTRGIFVHENGSVGLGNTNPISRLTINGGLYLLDDLDEDVVFKTGNYSIQNDNSSLAYRHMSDPEQHDFFVGGANRLAIASTGNIGIGTISPTATLDIAGTAKVSANAAIALDVTSSSSTAGAMAIRGTESSATSNTYGVFGVANSTAGIGVLGQAAAGTGSTSGVYGQNVSTSGHGVFGNATAATGTTYGGRFESTSTGGRGVYGLASAATGSTFGGRFQSNSTSGIGVEGVADASSGTTSGVHGRSDSTDGMGVFGETATTSGTTFGVRGVSSSTQGRGVEGESTATSGQTYGVRGVSASTTGRAVSAFASSQTGANWGVNAQSNSSQGIGARGFAPNLDGVTYGVYGEAWSSDGFGVYSDGDFASNGTKAFRIDHPDDPENRYLFHYCAESPEVINFYRGTVILDETGAAVVSLPDYFSRINRSPSYQLTAVGAAMPNLHVAEKISAAALAAGAAAEPGVAAPHCSFRIAGGAAGGEVSWRVEAVRNDRWMQTRDVPVEKDKSQYERGLYQRPELYGQPRERGISRPTEEDMPR